MFTLLSKLNFSAESDLKKLKGMQADDNFLTALSEHIGQIERNHADKVLALKQQIEKEQLKLEKALLDNDP